MTLLFGGIFTTGGIEVRAQGDGSRRLFGRFPYEFRTVLRKGKRSSLEESFASRAFAPRLDKSGEEIHLLVGHDFSKPLASRATGTLSLRETDDALHFEATVTRQIAETTHGRDALALIDAGLSVGLSPGFTVDADNERIERKNYAMVRTILAADLFELSIVTRPAYENATVDVRNWKPTTGGNDGFYIGLARSMERYR